MLNEQQATEHIKTLHDLASSAGISGKMILASYGEGVIPKVYHYQVGNHEEMAKQAISFSREPKRNVYMPLVVMDSNLPDKKKGEESDVIAVLGGVADFDEGRGQDYLRRCPAPPSFVLETSPNNAQCFYILETPIIIKSEEDRRRAKKLLSHLTDANDGADRCGKDLSHVWRIPDLLNYPSDKKIKAGRAPEPFQVGVKAPYEGKKFSEVDILYFPTSSSPEALDYKASCELIYKSPVDITDLLSKGLSDLVKSIVSDNAGKDRSEIVASVVTTLLKLGHGTGDIFDLFIENPDGIAARYKGNIERVKDDILRLEAKFNPQKENSVLSRNKFSLESLPEINEISLTPRRPILGNLFLRGKVTMVIAPPGVGKSSWTMGCGLSLASGLPFMGIEVHERCNVAIINNEDDMDELKRRILAIQKHYNIWHEQLRDRFFMQSGQNQKFLIAKKDESDRKLFSYHKEDLIEFCLENNIKFLCVDPYIETSEGDENDNRQMNEVFSMYREVAQRADCAVCIVHHTRKPSGASSSGHSGNMDSARGASSMVGAARVVVTLDGMSVQDAKDLGIAEEDRFKYVKMEEAKANLSLRSAKPLWYIKESVNLLNGDSVGVLDVCNDLQSKVETSKNFYQEQFMITVDTHEAFEELALNGKMPREPFIKAMEFSKSYLGVKCGRGALQKRTEKFLLGNGITHDGKRLYMTKAGGKNGRYTVHYEKVSSSATLPQSHVNFSGNVTQKGLEQKMPTVAEIYVAFASQAAENLLATLPPLKGDSACGTPL